MQKFILLISSLFYLSSCATVFSGSSQNIKLQVLEDSTKLPIDSVRCTVNDGYGDYVISSNPATVRVKKGSGSIAVSCVKENYRQLNTMVGDSFNAVSLVNVIFWPGFFVDAMSGAYKSYPSHYTITMEKIKNTQ